MQVNAATRPEVKMSAKFDKTNDSNNGDWITADGVADGGGGIERRRSCSARE